VPFARTLQEIRKYCRDEIISSGWDCHIGPHRCDFHVRSLRQNAHTISNAVTCKSVKISNEFRITTNFYQSSTLNYIVKHEHTLPMLV